MSGAWLVSYIVLWGVVFFQGVLIFLLLRQLGVMYLGTAQGIARDGLAVGKRAPDFTVPDLEGRPLTLSQFRGRSLLLVFGAANCKPCQNLMPDLNAFAEEHRDQLSALYLSRSEPDAARQFVLDHDVRVPVAVHPDETLMDRYEARVTPFAFIIDGDGVVRAKGLANTREHLEMLLLVAKGDEREQAPSRNGAAAEGARKEEHA